MSMLRFIKSFDYLLAAAVVAMAVFGVVMIYAAGTLPQFSGLYASQRLYVITGFILMLVISLVDYHTITRFYIPIYIFGLLLLVVARLIGADSATGTSRWIWIPIPGRDDISIQPSEFFKIFMILFMAKLLEVKKDTFNQVPILSLIMLLILVPVYMIQAQPSLSASIVVAVVSMIILFTAGLYYRTILAGLAVLLPAVLALWFDMRRATPLLVTKILDRYQWERIQTYLNPIEGSDDYWQVQSSLFAIGSGKLYGKGFLNNSYVSNGHNDFIFATIAEQFGFAGGAIVLAVMIFIIIKCILVALRAFDLQGRLIAAGVAGMLIFEAFVNVSVATALLPNTGMPFPFLSHGGSTMWVHMVAIGLVLNVSIPREKPMFGAEEDERPPIIGYGGEVTSD